MPCSIAIVWKNKSKSRPKNGSKIHEVSGKEEMYGESLHYRQYTWPARSDQLPNLGSFAVSFVVSCITHRIAS